MVLNAFTASYAKAAGCRADVVSTCMSDYENGFMEISEFRETGFLQEANRQFFHPHGLALSVNMGFKDKKELEEWMIQKSKESDAASEDLLPDEEYVIPPDTVNIVWTFIEHMGMNKPYLGSIMTTTDPEGFFFGFTTHEEAERGLERVANVREVFNRHVKPRMDGPGYVVQPPETFHNLFVPSEG